MIKAEKTIIQNVVKNLRKSLKTNWKEGNIDQWAAFAKNMKSKIENNCEVLESFLEEDDKIEDPKIKNIEELL